MSEREVEVLRLVGAGLGNKHVAEQLYLSLSSVKSHLSHTYGRLGVSGRAAAVAEARRQGLI
nr:LuxR C-terminal-related transcriptional regulator [Janibacter cremeus]